MSMLNKSLRSPSVHSGIAMAVSCFAVLALYVGSSTAKKYPPPDHLASSAVERFPLHISPDPVSIGAVSPGRLARASLTLTNFGSKAVTIARVETSCDCLSTGPARVSVGAGGSRTLTLVFDSSTEPSFRGELSIDVKGYDEREMIVFSTDVNVQVTSDRAESAGGGYVSARRPSEGGPP